MNGRQFDTPKELYGAYLLAWRQLGYAEKVQSELGLTIDEFYDIRGYGLSGCAKVLNDRKSKALGNGT